VHDAAEQVDAVHGCDGHGRRPEAGAVEARLAVDVGRAVDGRADERLGRAGVDGYGVVLTYGGQDG